MMQSDSGTKLNLATATVCDLVIRDPVQWAGCILDYPYKHNTMMQSDSGTKVNLTTVAAACDLMIWGTVRWMGSILN